jgi:hypothetical protein
MARRILIVLGALVLIGLAVTLVLVNRRYEATKVKYADTRASEDSLRTHYEAALGAITEIQDSLSAIMPSESQVLDLSRDIESRTPLTETRREQVLRTISDLNSSIESSKGMIRRLEKRLKDSQVKIQGLERLVNNLKQMVAEREKAVRLLTGKVDSLKVQVAVLQSDVAAGKETIQEKERIIGDRNRELSTIYYVIGSRKDLKRLGLVRETGGVIGLGRTPRLSGDFDPQVFTPLDTDRQTQIQIPGQNPIVLTAQSASSYELRPLSKDWYELHILKPEEFRKVRYLVIEAR